MKKLLSILMVITMVCGLIVLSGCGKEEDSSPKDDKATTEEATEEAKEESIKQFDYKSLTLEVASVEEYTEDQNDSEIEEPEGKYVNVICRVLNGKEEITSDSFSELCECIFLNGVKAVNVTYGGIMNIENNVWYASDQTVFTFYFDMPADFDVADAVITAEQ